VRILQSVVIITALSALAACGGSNTQYPVPTPTFTPAAPGSLGALTTISTIASTVDVGTGAGAGDNNPYGLAIAPVTAGLETAGDLIVCNFNNASGTQGAGTTIEDISPTPGSTPKRLVQSSQLAGCNAIAMSSGGNIWAADYTANNNPIVSTSGTIVTTIAQGPWAGPWGQAFNSGKGGKPAFFATNANNGTVIRININPGPSFTFDTILTGLTYSGAPGNLLAPAGLTYDPASDTLYLVDSNKNRLIKIASATTAPANTYAATGSTFNTAAVTTVFSGAPLAAPISSALLANGDIVVGNTAAVPQGNNLLVEINPTGQYVVSYKNVDTGAAGAIFGIAATNASGAQYIYFNDDNDNTVKRVSP
jgi:hypothetical protein